MKKLVFVFTILLGLNTPSMAQLDLDILKGSSLVPQQGTILVYGVDYYGNEYDFIIQIIKLKKDEVVFDYLMTSGKQTTGRVMMTGEALESATAQLNAFRGGPDTLHDMTSVWISRKVFKELTGEKGKSAISPNGGLTSVELIAKRVGYDYSIFDYDYMPVKDIAYYYAESADGQIKYWINSVRGVPIILKMDLGWKIWLKSMGKAD